MVKYRKFPQNSSPVGSIWREFDVNVEFRYSIIDKRASFMLEENLRDDVYFH